MALRKSESIPSYWEYTRAQETLFEQSLYNFPKII